MMEKFGLSITNKDVVKKICMHEFLLSLAANNKLVVVDVLHDKLYDTNRFDWFVCS